MFSTDEEKRSSQARLQMRPPSVDTAVDAKFRMGISMLTAADAAQNLPDALGIIESAAAAGHAEATERRAVFECAGIARSSDWNKALDSLAEAAELGSERAARQLILLAEDRFAAAAPFDTRAGLWREVRSRISVGQRLQAPTARRVRLCAEPLVVAISPMATAAECQWLIGAATPWLEKATLYNKGVSSNRTNEYAVLDLVRTDLVAEMIRARIANEIGAPLQCLEVSQLLRYRPGEEFLLHCDFLNPEQNREEIERFGQRSATLLIYLNDDYDGGNTSFPKLHIDHRGGTGDALVFGNLLRDRSPDHRTQHAGRPPTRGEKWVFSQWVRDR